MVPLSLTQCPGPYWNLRGGPLRTLVGCLFFYSWGFLCRCRRGASGGVRLYRDTYVSGSNLLFPFGLDRTKRSHLRFGIGGDSVGVAVCECFWHGRPYATAGHCTPGVVKTAKHFPLLIFYSFHHCRRV